MRRRIFSDKGFSVVELLILIVVLAVIGTGSFFVVKHRQASHVGDALIISRNSVNDGVVTVKGFTASVDNISAATILHDIKALPAAHWGSGVVNCPLDIGLVYTFTFKSPAIIYTADPSGCGGVSLKGSTTSYSLGGDTGKTLWKDVSKATGQSIDPVRGY